MKTRTRVFRICLVTALLMPALSPRSLALRRGGALPYNSAQAETKNSAVPQNKGSLFSAILFGRTELGERWAKLRSEAESLFPQLKLKSFADLHMTLIYIGKEWDVEKLAVLRQALSLPIRDAIRFTPEITVFGKNNQVVVVELKGMPEELKGRIIELKQKFNEAGLKSPEASDNSYRAHVTLAETKNSPPTEEQVRDLAAFRERITSRLDLPTLNVVLDPTMPIQWLLAGATRPTPIPEYITVESFLANK